MVIVKNIMNRYSIQNQHLKENIKENTWEEECGADKEIHYLAMIITILIIMVFIIIIMTIIIFIIMAILIYIISQTISKEKMIKNMKQLNIIIN